MLLNGSSESHPWGLTKKQHVLATLSGTEKEK
jgi:hypothetical protein